MSRKFFIFSFMWIALILPGNLQAQTVSGTVFRDYNADGTLDVGSRIEPGIAGISVDVFDGTGANVGSATTLSDGTYSAALSVGAGTDVRVEFTGLPSYLHPAPVGADSGTTVIFAQSGDSGIDLGLHNPGEHCQDDPDLVTSCYIFGDQSTAVAPYDEVIVRFTYTAGNDGSSSTPSDYDIPAHITEATAPDVGPTFGLAYHSASDSLFAAAYMKRHTGYGPDGPGAVYIVDRGTMTASTFLDINALFPGAAGTDSHPMGTNFDEDPASWDPVGKAAFGGMDLSDDQETLYLMNLFDRQLYQIPVGLTPTAPAAMAINRFPVPTPPGCAAGDVRPFAVKFYDGLVYIGIVCSAESTGMRTDLDGYIYSFDPSNSTFTLRLSFPLDYTRGCANNATNANCNNPASNDYQPADWQAWSGTWTGFFHPFATPKTLTYPQPMISDIAFDDGDMVIGVRDRLGDQTGTNTPEPGLPMGNLYVGISAGDILRACANGGGWTMETDGSCGGITTAGMGNGQGLGGGEYFDEEFYRLGTLIHTETAVGGLTQIPGFPDVLSTVFDPVVNTSLPNNTIYDGGVHWYENATADLSRAYRVYEGPNPGQPVEPLFGKANGLGDLEPLCDAPSIEIGNRVWDDSNGNGVQDPGEAGLAGVSVTLFSAAPAISVTIMTDGSGNFLFNDGNVGGGIPSGVSFELRIDPADVALGGRIPTLADNGSNDIHDSDGSLMGGMITIPFTSGSVGVSNHSYDFGFAMAGTIGDFIWEDTNGDTMQAGEAGNGIGNVTVDLIRDTNGNGMIDGGEMVIDTQTTNGSGAYDFTMVIPGDYIVDVTDTNNVLTTFTLTTANDPLAVSLSMGQDFNDADFGYQQQVGTIGDFVWNDLNGDGVQDGGEPGLGNVTLDLIDDANGNGVIDGGEMVIATQTTNGSGAYDFTALSAGDYIVQVTDTNNVLTNFTLTGGTDPLAVSLAAGQDFNDADFGYQQTNATIGDFVWNDLNGDGVQDGGEPGLGNVTLDLIDDANGNGVIDGGEMVVATQTTNGSGAYDFTGLAVGDYIVQVTDTNNVLTNFTLTGGTDPLAVSLAAGQDFNDADFGYQQTNASIGDFVWNDLNGDGVQDGGEPGLGNVTLDLIDDANGNGVIDGGEMVIATQTTNGSGAYDFTGLAAGFYIVQVTDTNNVLTNFTLTGGTDPLAVSLAAGQDFNDADFGYQQTNATIGDFVWNDLDGDGVQDGGESGLGNVTLDLIDDANGNGVIDGGEMVVATQTTNGSGAYDFTGLAAGFYIVQVTDTNNVLTNFTLTGGTDPLAVSLAAGQDFNDADFGYQQTDASIGDFVWNDLNGDGVQDGGEPGLGNVTLDLIDDANGNGVIDGGEMVIATQTTNGSGAYDFTGLAAGDYIVQVTDTNNVLTNFTLTGGTNPLAVSKIAGQDFDDADFGYQQTDASIGDFVWNDLNGDGVQDGGEPGLGNVTLDLIDDANGNGVIDGGEMVLATQTTNGSGAYDFTGLAAGFYIVQVTDTNNVLTNFTLTGGTDPLAVSLAAGQDFNDADFGYQQTNATIGDFVWNDLNGDGVQDGGEPGLGNVTLDLIDDANGNGVIDGGEMVIATQTTNGSGAYDFTGLAAGDYIVQVTDTNNVLTTFNLTGGTDPLSVALSAGQDFNDADFGYQQTNASIGDFVWNDLNGDGVQDGGEPGLSNVTLDLIDDANGNGVIDGGEMVIATQTTNGSGIYDFTNLSAGDYIVQVTDTNNVLTNFTLTGGTDPLAVSVTAAEDFNDADFGYQQTNASIGDFVWNDLNGDGVQDGGEPGLSNVTLDLIDDANGNGVIDGGEMVLATQTTNGSGAYDFTGLAAGDYIVQVTDTNNVLTNFTLTGGTDPLPVTLSAGLDFDDADFGYQQTDASIGDFVWDDLNGDGVQDGGEPGLANVTLDLIDDANGNGVIDGGEMVLATQTTNGSGAYDFTGLAAGNYIVQVTDTNNVLTDFTLTGGTDPLAVTVTAGQDFDDADFGYQQTNASIGDFVWNDLNGDGVQDGGEPGLANVTLDLYEDTNGNGVIDGGEMVIATQTTNGSGAYDFTGLAAGNYIVQVTDTNNVLTNFTLTGGTDPLPVTKIAGQNFDDADFGYQQTNASIGDFVWNDLNGDGVQDGGEPGLGNVTIDLYEDTNGNGVIDGGEMVIATQTTNGSGAFDFTGLSAGDYILVVTDTNNVLTDFTLTGGTDPLAVTVTAGQDFDDADFGYQQTNASIGDFVWNDLNGDGVQDGGEPGLSNVTLDLYEDTNGNGVIDGGEMVIATQTTNGSGAFDFTGLAAGDYIVQVTDTNNVLTDFTLTGGTDPLAVTVTAGQDFDDADFGYQQTNASIGDFVWNDLNGDGVQDGGEPGLSNVTLDLIDDANGNGVIDGGESVIATQTTDGSGNYDFTGLAVGDYIVQVTDTNNVLTTFNLTGGTEPLPVTLSAGQDFDDADFGYQQTNASIGDFVWNDLNGDGVQDGGEPGLANVTLDLYEDTNGNGVIDGGEMVIGTQTTNGSGIYDFTNLSSGDYIVQVTDTNNVLTNFNLTGGVDPLAVTVTAAEDFNDADFGYQQTNASIGDFVWNDLNGDGIQDGGEPGLANVTLDLIDDANGNGVIDGGEMVIATETTDGSGNYDFTGLTAGDYIVVVTDTNNVLTGYSLTGGTDPLPVTLSAGQDFDDADFGYQQTNASIGDFVWNDLNGDGVQDGGEPGLANVTLDLYEDTNGNGVIDGGEMVIATETTDGSGAYDFSGLAAGDYIVVVTDTNNVLTGFNLTGGTDPLAVTKIAGQDFDDADFGYQQTNASIGDFVWNDLNGDGIQDGGEPGIANVTLDLYEDSNGNGVIDGGEMVIATETTDGSGNYDFTGLTAGDYIVVVTDTNNVLTGLNLTGGTNPLAVTKVAGQDFDDADFGYQDPGTATIGDLVWNDFNGNGSYDIVKMMIPEEGIGNVTLDLIDDQNGNGVIDMGEPVLATETTDGTGFYDFTGLVAGDYIVDVTDTNNVLTGYSLTGGTDPFAVTGLTVGQDFNDADFGYNIETPVIGAAKNATLNGTEVTLDFYLENLGNVILSNLMLPDDLDAVFGAGNYIITSPPSFQDDPGTINLEAGFDGSSTTALIAAGSTLAVGATAQIRVVLDVTNITDQGMGLGVYENQVIATGEGPGGGMTSDPSDNGTEPDPDGNGDPGDPDEDDPTPIILGEEPQIGAAKDAAVAGNMVTIDLYLENLGNVALDQLSMPEDLDVVFGAGNYALSSPPVLLDDPGTIVLNGAFDGSNDTEVLVAGSTLSVGATAQIRFVVTVHTLIDQGMGYGVYENQVTASGQGPGGTQTSDDSDDGTDPDPNGNGDPTEPGEEDPTPIVIPENPVIGLAKQAGATVNNGDGTYTVPLTFLVSNLGNIPLNSVQVTDDLDATFTGTATYSVIAGPTAALLTANPGFDGSGDINLLAGTDTMAVGSSASITVSIRFDPMAEPGPFMNTAIANGTGPGGGMTSDNSDDGTDPDTNGNGDPGDPDEDDPTPIEIPNQPVIGIAKQASSAVMVGAGVYETEITLVVENTGNVPLTNVQVTDNLNDTFMAPVTFSVVAGPTSMDFIVNPAYDGDSDISLLMGVNTLTVGASGAIQFTVQFTPTGIMGTFFNQAMATAEDADGNPTDDLSDDGNDPDADDDGNPNEPDENDPTPINIGDNPVIAIAKRASPSVSLGGGQFQTTITLEVENLGNVDLTMVAVSDDLNATFTGSATFMVTAPPVASGTLAANGSYDGDSDVDLLIPASSTLPVGALETISFDVIFEPNGVPGPFLNSAGASADGGGITTTDTSDDGNQTDPNGNGDPGEAGENDPTPIDYLLEPVIGVSKQAGPVSDLGGGNYEVTLSFIVGNYGNVALDLVQVTDDLIATFPPPVTYAVTAGPTAVGLTPNPGFDGDADQNLLAGSDSLAIGASGTIEFTVEFQPMGLTGPFHNQAVASGEGPGMELTTDLSDDGTDPDSNGNNDPNEPVDNDPTPIEVPLAPFVEATKTDAIVVRGGVAMPGDTLRYTVVVTNSGDQDAFGVIFDSSVDPNTALVVGSVTTSQGTVTTGNDPGDTTVSVSLGTLPANGGTATITFDVQIDDPLSPGVMSVVCQGNVSGDNFPTEPTDDPDTGPDDDPTVTPLDNEPVVDATKADALLVDQDMDGLVDPGDTIRYTVEILNTGGGSALNVDFTSAVDPNTSLVVGSVTTSQGTVTTGNDPGDTSVAVDVGDIPGSGSVTITFDVVVDNPLPKGITQVSCQGTVSGDNFGDVPTDDPDTGPTDDPTDTPIEGNPLVEASKSDALLIDMDMDGLVDAGDTLRYTVVITNTGTRNATETVFSSNVDVNTDLVVGSVTTSQGTVTTGNDPGDASVAVAIGTHVVGEIITITFDVTVVDPIPPGVTEVVCQGLVSGGNFNDEPTDDPDTGPDDDPTVTPLELVPVVTITKSSTLLDDLNGDGFLNPGEGLTYVIDIFNEGPVIALNSVFSDTPDPNTSLNVGTVTTTMGTVISGNNPGDTMVFVDIGDMAVLGSVSISFDVTLDDPLDPAVIEIVNQGFVNGSNFDEAASDDPNTSPNGDPTADEIIIPVEVPTLGEWGLILMVFLLLVAGVRAMRLRERGSWL